MIRLLNRADVESVFDMDAAFEMAKAAFSALDHGAAVMPTRAATRVEKNAGTHLSMPCFVEDPQGDVLSIKVVSVFERNPVERAIPAITGFLLLHDAKTGELLSLMDAEHLTAMRTGAASALATDLLAQPDASTVTIFGAGAQAETQLQGVSHVRAIKRAYVVSTNKARADDFAKRMSSRLGISVEATEEVGTAVKGSQILCTATTSQTPVFNSRELQPGTHINSVGAFRPDMRELDDRTIARAMVYVDQLEAAQGGAGDLIQAVESGAFRWNQLAGELGGLVNGRAPRRASADQITIFKSVGLAVQDAFAARFTYERAVVKGLGTLFSLS